MRRVPLPHELQLGPPILVACESVQFYESAEQCAGLQTRHLNHIRNRIVTVYH